MAGSRWDHENYKAKHWILGGRYPHRLKRQQPVIVHYNLF